MPRRCSFKLELEFPQPLAGVDEAGCAPLAGPVVAAACILNRDKFPRGIDDSKNLPLEKREALYAKLTKCAAWGVGLATVEEIDQINIYWARMLAMTRAVEALGLEPAWVLVDGNATPRWQRPSKAIVDGDAKCRSIAAASIIAKVTRDRIMAQYARTIPATGGRRTAVIRLRITAVHFGNSGRRRCTGRVSGWCVKWSSRLPSPNSSSKSSRASLPSHTPHRLSSAPTPMTSRCCGASAPRGLTNCVPKRAVNP